MKRMLLPPSKPDNERRANYDYRIRNAVAGILQYRGDAVEVVGSSDKDSDSDAMGEPHSRLFEWDVGICYVPFGFTRLIPSSSAKRKLSHWGVYFSRVDNVLN